MHSIRFRLIALFVLLVTLSLAGSGVYSQLRLSRDLEQGFVERQKAVMLRLTTSLPVGVWNYDLPQSRRIIEAEIGSREVSAISVFHINDTPFVSVDGTTRGDVTNRAEASHFQTTVSANLFADTKVQNATSTSQENMLIGRVDVVFTREAIEASLRASLVSRVVEIVVLDALLVVALIVSLNMVFKPIGQLRDALFELAQHHGEDAEELPETSRGEFGEVIRGFNQTQRRLRQVIRRRAQAEDAARDAVKRAEQAFRDLQAAQESLVQSEKLAGLGSMVAGVAHEINTPVGILITSASVLHQETLRTSQAMAQGAVRKSDMTAYLQTAEESVKLIMSNAERAAHLIQSFKQVAVDQTSEQRRSFDVRVYLDELTTSLHPALKKANARIQIACPHAIQMDSYPGLLAQVLTNLIMNAVTHAFASDQGGTIDISVSEQVDHIHIAVSDNGCGIPQDHLDRIFEPFFTTRRGLGGTGLGLHIVFNIVTKHLGGTLSVHNVEPHGACFELSCPLIAPQPQKPR